MRVVMERAVLEQDTEGVGSNEYSAENVPLSSGVHDALASMGIFNQIRKWSQPAMQVRGKLVLVLTFVGAVLLAICGGLTVLDFGRHLSSHSQERAEMVALIMRNAVLAGESEDGLDQIIRATAGAAGVQSIALADAQGQVIAANHEDWRGVTLQQLSASQKIYSLDAARQSSTSLIYAYDAPVAYEAIILDQEGHRAGQVLVWLDMRAEAEELAEAAWRLMVWLTVGVILSILIISLILHRIFVAPIESLWRFARTRSCRSGPPMIQDEIADIGNVLTESIAATCERDMALADLAMRDSLTGLGNRSYFKDKLAEAIDRAGERGETLAVLVLNLNQFKDVNDTLGHDSGDHVLKRTADILKNCCGENDVVARVSGDEFGILLDNLSGADEAIDYANRFIRAVGVPCRIGPHELHLNSCIGITLFPQDGRDKDVLVKNADLALLRAKYEGAGSCSLYRHELHLRSIERSSIERDLRHAISRGQLELYYQPKLSVATGSITGVEALIRWYHPERGYISPAVFIPVAERCGIIAELTRWVLDEACRQNREWQVKGLPRISVAVNVSAVDLRRPDLTDAIANLLVRRGLSPQYLELEVTESMVMRDVDLVIGTLRRLRGLGIGISIDDFGTGYSSLAYLKRFPVKRLKIDRSFVSDIANKRGGQVIPKVIIDLAHALGIHVVAEGVETALQLDMLRTLGCDEAQGFLLGRPMPASEFELFLAHTPPVAGDGAEKRRISVA